MKIFLFSLSVLLWLNGFSQNNSTNKEANKYKEVKIFSSEKNPIKDENIAFIDVTYADQQASYVKLFTKNITIFNGIKENHYYFDLNFKGDRYILNQNYSWFHLPDVKGINPQNIPKNGDTNYISRISFYRDSTLYYFTKHKDFQQIIPLWMFPAKYLGSIDTLQQQIAKQLSTIQSDSVTDSICVLEIILSRTGEVKEIKSIGGKNSNLDNTSKRIMLLEKNRKFDKYKYKWEPAVVYSSGRPIDTKVKMFIKLREDGSIEILLPKTMQNLTGN